MAKRKKQSRRKRTLAAEYRQFAKEYIGPSRFNGTEAMLRVRPKLSRKSAASQASRWLGNAEVQTHLDKAYNRVIERIDLETDEITRQFVNLAMFDIRELAEWDEDGKVSFRASDEIDLDTARCIAGVTVHSTQHGSDTRFKLHDRVRGLEGLARIKGMFGVDAPVGSAVLVLRNLHPPKEAE